jgi:O-antigen/teichoic acid export membrane protein
MMTAASQTSAAAPFASGESLRRCFVIGAFWSLFGAVLARGLTLAASVLAGRLLGTTGFGEVGMIQSTQGLFGVLAGAGLGLAATKYVAEYRTVDWAKAGRCITLATMIAIGLGSIASLGLFAFSSVIAVSVLKAPHLESELQVASGLVLFAAINGVQIGALAGLGDFRIMAFLGILRGVCLFAALTIGIVSGGVMGGVIGLVVTEGISVIANQFALRRLFPDLWDGWRTTLTAWKELADLCRFGGLAVLGSMATMLAMWFSNVVLVSQPEGYAALGIFNAAERWRQLLLFLPASVSPIILSMLSNLHGKNDPAGYRQLLGVNLGVTAATVFVPTVVIMMFAPLAMSVFGAEYQDGWLTLIILAASAVAAVLNNLLGQVLVSKGAIWSRVLLDIFMALVLALVSWQMVPEFRDKGLAWANLIAYAATVVAMILPVVYCLRAPMRNSMRHS